MSSSVHFNLLAGFRAVNAWQKNIIKNAEGLLQPGYNKSIIHMGGQPSGNTASGSQATASGGSTNATFSGGDTLSVSGYSLSFQQGEIQTAASPTQLAIKGEGFFIVAENLRPGARLMLTRAGDFHYDTQGRLVNGQGLFVVGGGGNLTDPPTPVMNPGDGSVVLPSLTLARVPVKNNLGVSNYGPTIYDVTPASGALQPFANGDPAVGFVQSGSLEYFNRVGIQAEIQVETTQAQQTYKMFKDLLDNYNRSVDDAINTVK